MIVEIYSSGSCFYCVAAKYFLYQHGQSYAELRIDTDPAIYRAMLERSQRRSVPQIFIDGEHIGGFEDLVAAERAGKLTTGAGDAT